MELSSNWLPETVKAALDWWQYRQELHDSKYHVDIYALPKAKRLAHLTLHHCKYVAELYAMSDTTLTVQPGNLRDMQLRERFLRRAIDGVIVCLSISNIVNEKIPLKTFEGDWKPKQLIRDYSIGSMGRLAKIIEDIDHMAQVNPLQQIHTENLILLAAYVGYLRMAGISTFEKLFEGIGFRLEAVESKHMFHDKFQEEIKLLLR